VIKAVLPVMRQQGSGRIINVSTVVGQVAPPYMGVFERLQRRVFRAGNHTHFQSQTERQETVVSD